jgi:hypothetical protein
LVILHPVTSIRSAKSLFIPERDNKVVILVDADALDESHTDGLHRFKAPDVFDRRLKSLARRTRSTKPNELLHLKAPDVCYRRSKKWRD